MIVPLSYLIVEQGFPSFCGTHKIHFSLARLGGISGQTNKLGTPKVTGRLERCQK
jgi:hypothetical protein